MTIMKKSKILLFFTTMILIILIFFVSRVRTNIEEEYKKTILNKDNVIHLYEKYNLVNSAIIKKDMEELLEKEKKIKSLDHHHSDDHANHTEELLEEEDKLNHIIEDIFHLYKTTLKLEEEFKDTYEGEKKIRYRIRDLIDDERDYVKVKTFGNIMYLSKESFFQYRDEKHFNLLKEELKTFKGLQENNNILNDYANMYSLTIDKLIDIVKKENENFQKITEILLEYNEVIEDSNKRVDDLAEKNEKELKRVDMIFDLYLFIILSIFILLTICIVIFIYKKIIYPIKLLQEQTKNISNKEFISVDIKGNDEISLLIKSFNDMSNKLAEVYLTLEERVNNRTKELKKSNQGLLEKIRENERLQSILKERSETDELTKLFNRRKAYEVLKQSIIDAKTGARFVVCFLDLDNFKQVNDTKGHEAGDNILKSFSNSLMKNTRVEDYIFRMGGDEFIILFSNRTKEDVDKFITERITPQLKKDVEIGFSYGLTEISKESNSHLSIDEILEESDKKMYKQKQLNKNKVL